MTETKRRSIWTNKKVLSVPEDIIAPTRHLGWNWSVQVEFRHVARITVSLPLTGFIFGVLYAVYVDGEEASRTECGARNFLPSASAAIGGFPLSQFFWKLCIGLHTPPRFAVIMMYYEYLKSVLPETSHPLVRVTCGLYIIEIISLLALTLVTSYDHYVLHQRFFIVFMLTSTLYMIILTYLLSNHRVGKMSDLEDKSLMTKQVLLVTFLTACSLGSYFFVRHRKYCEDGMYTVFSFMEYIVILSNMGYHMTAYWDFYSRVVTLGSAKSN